MDVIPASHEDLCRFHSSLYIDFLQKISKNYTSVAEENKELVANALADECEDFGIGTIFMALIRPFCISLQLACH